MVCSADERQSGVQYAEIVIGEKAPFHPQGDVVLNMPPTAAHHLQQAQQQQQQAAKAEDPKKRAWLLVYCFLGIMVSFTLNGLVLEKITTHRVLGEMSLTFVFCLFYALVALGLRAANKEKPSTMPQSMLGIVGVLAFGSTISSMVALRYVTFITRILGKSCKSIPVMLVGVLLGKTFAFKKYVSVVVLSIGVAIFLVGTAHEKQHRAVQHNEEHDHVHERTPNMFLGISLLLVSLLFDGATGALEDKYMEKYHIGAFDLMYVVNIYKCVFSAVGMVVMGEVPEFLEYLMPSLPNLILLSLTGAMGQAFIFYTISKFGALTTSIIGTCRKVLSIVLSVIMFGHILSLEQTIGLALSFVGIGLNWVRFSASCLPFGKKKQQQQNAQQEREMEKLHDLEASDLLFESSDDTADSEEEDSSSASTPTSDEEGPLRNKEVERGLELVNVWARQSQQLAEDDEKKTALVSDGENLAAQAV